MKSHNTWGKRLNNLNDPEKLNAVRFSRNLRLIREQKGLTKAQVCELCGISNRAIVDVEGARTSVKISTLKKISDGLNLPIDLLFTPIPHIEILTQEEI